MEEQYHVQAISSAPETLAFYVLLDSLVVV